VEHSWGGPTGTKGLLPPAQGLSLGTALCPDINNITALLYDTYAVDVDSSELHSVPMQDKIFCQNAIFVTVFAEGKWSSGGSNQHHERGVFKLVFSITTLAGQIS